MPRKTIKVDYLARVEGEGALYVRFDDQGVADVQLKIFEPPRFFEAFLRGRPYRDAPDITARICGICPVAYQMSSVHAMEQALGIQIQAGPLRELRRLLYCGEWIESHALHIFMLHAPDFLGFPDAIQMAQAGHSELVKKGLEIKKIGNQIVSLIGGREVHPVNVQVGGFYRTPTKKELAPLREKLLTGRDLTLETLKWLTEALNFPDFSQDYEFVALRHPHEYPFNEGRLVSNKGLDIAAEQFEDFFTEIHVEHSNALHCVLKQRGSYFVGPMARYSLNFERLPPAVQSAARDAGLGEICTNPFQSILVRAIEVLYAFEEALRIIESYTEPERPAVSLPAPGESNDSGGAAPLRGHGITEAPRGILYHRYELNSDGSIQSAKIVPPTSQNQKQIEDDLWKYCANHMNLDDERLTWECEQAIRNYDPCISCATHFLKLKVERS